MLYLTDIILFIKISLFKKVDQNRLSFANVFRGEEQGMQQR